MLMQDIKNLCFEQLKLIEQSFINLACDLENVVKNIQNNTGILFFTGIGKNGHVAAKTASTFSSIGIRSIFINPVDAVHGDMGNLTKNDIIFAISNSGNTEELINFLSNIRKNEPEIKIILLTSNKNPKAGSLCSEIIYIPVSKELDKFNIVPTVSISVYTIFLQSLGIYVSENNQFTLNNFKKNHPGGNIGKILNDKS